MPYMRKARPTELHTPWFRSVLGKGTTNVASYGKLAICGRCGRLFNNWDARYSPREGVLCVWCWNNVEPCKYCGTFYPYGSLDFTKICDNCRNSGRWIMAEHDKKKIKVLPYRR